MRNFVSVAVFVLSLCVSARLGHAQESLHFSGKLKVGGGEIVVSAQIDPDRFLVVSTTDEFRAIRVRIDNFTKERLVLRKEDFLTATSESGNEVTCGFDISKSAGWQKLLFNARQRMAYPSFVDSMEQEMVFAFAPMTVLDFIPAKLTFTFGANPPIRIELKLEIYSPE